MDRKAPAIAQNLQNWATTILVGGWNRATLPHVFTGRLPPGYWLVIGIAAPAQLMQQYLSGSPTPIFPNFAKSYFSTLSTYIAQHCILMLNGAISYFLAPVFHTFLSHHCCSAAHWQSMCGGTEVQKNVILTKIRSALLYFYPYSILFYIFFFQWSTLWKFFQTVLWENNRKSP